MIFYTMLEYTQLEAAYPQVDRVGVLDGVLLECRVKGSSGWRRIPQTFLILRLLSCIVSSVSPWYSLLGVITGSSQRTAHP